MLTGLAYQAGRSELKETKSGDEDSVSDRSATTSSVTAVVTDPEEEPDISDADGKKIHLILGTEAAPQRGGRGGDPRSYRAATSPSLSRTAGRFDIRT